jgi:minor extracellular serine protease Vpr
MSQRHFRLRVNLNSFSAFLLRFALNSKFKFVVSMSTLGLALAACSPTSSSGTFKLVNNLDAGIISTRPQTAADTVLILKLSTPALFTTLKIKDGKKQVDPDTATTLMKEQDDLIAKLATLSPKIQVLYRYRLLVNGLAIVAPISALDQIRKLTNVAYVETQTSFGRPVLAEEPALPPAPIPTTPITRTSVQFIGADQAQSRGIRGQGMRIGIIDTGIDYTHAMFGGAGTADAYKAVDPTKDNPGFPTAKVVGGIDLVGTDYNSDSADFSKRTPHADKNPLDEAGHGSHVAGTVAGHGDGINTYDGVAPDAALYAIKVFGKNGSTGDAAVVAGLEYAADPNSDLNFDDQLDVVNLSLGSSYGSPHILYTQAMMNLSKAGTVVVASAGNSGDTDYIVGSPSVAEDAISVAASVDDMDQNWKFRAVEFGTVDEPSIFVEAIEGPVSKPLAEIGTVTGVLVPAGIADQDFNDDLKAKLKGQVALIDRGVVPFAKKIERAFDAGAIGVIVVNNVDGEPISMGGDGHFDIPAVMIKKDLGEKLKLEIAKGPATVAFNTPKRIEKPELIDTIASFSSKGPRSFDALLKPEISAPGSQIISAKMGAGNLGVQLSGTSMAAPHMTGVMALLKQAHPLLNSAELKSLAMSTAKPIHDETAKPYPLSRQGAGRVQVINAIDAQVVSLPASLSLGEVTIETKKMLRRELTLKSLASNDSTYDLSFEGDPSLSMKIAATVAGAGDSKTITLKAGESRTITLEFTVSTSNLKETSTELDGELKLSSAGKEMMHIPVIAVANKVSDIQATSLVIHSTSIVDSQGAAVDLNLKNASSQPGEAYAFNLIGEGSRKQDPYHDPFMDRGCNLQQAGYRVIEKDGVQVLQFAVKLFEPMTTWDNCEVSILIDSDRDGIPDQELVGAKQDHLKGMTQSTFASLLLDAPKARALRKQFELDTLAEKKDVTESYKDAVVDVGAMFAPQFSTIAIVESPISDLKLRGSGELAVRILTSYQELSAVQPDDILENGTSKWDQVNVGTEGSAFVHLPEKISLAPAASQTVSFAKGAGNESLVLFSPMNAPVIGGLSNDRQSEIPAVTFAP